MPFLASQNVVVASLEAWQRHAAGDSVQLLALAVDSRPDEVKRGLTLCKLVPLARPQWGLRTSVPKVRG